MARKKRHANEAPEEGEERRASAPAIGTSLAGLLKGVKLEPRAPKAKKPAEPRGPARPSPPSTTRGAGPVAPATAPPSARFERPSERLRGNDRIAFDDTFAGVRGLDDGKPRRKTLAAPAKPIGAPRRATSEADAGSRRRLDALVAGAFTFDVSIDEEGFVEGLRRDAPIAALDALRREEVRVDRTFDLHGEREAAVEERLPRALREAHGAGARRVLVIHGKGLHSSDGLPVLRDAVLRVLEASRATPLVLAFASAPRAMGGTGALLVELARRGA